MGLTPEGIDQNPVIYDLATDLMWRKEAPDLTQWLAQHYAAAVWGPNQETGNQSVGNSSLATAYNRPPQWSGTTCTLINVSPRLNAAATRNSESYPPQRLVPAWEALAAAATELGDVDPFRFDLVDVSRQVLANLATAIHERAVAAYWRKDAADLRARRAARFLELMDDMEALLSTRGEFMLGCWIKKATDWATTDDERKLYEWNARTQITMWGDRTTMLRDYARKEWSGLIRDFYKPRWSRYFDELAKSVESGTEFGDEALQKELRAWEEEWGSRRDVYPVTPNGDSVVVSRRLLEKYRPVFAEVYRENQSLVSGKPVKASGGTADGHPPEYAVTGVADRSSFWSASPAPQWLQVDLQTPTEVDCVVVFPFWDGKRSYQYTVETSLDGSAWTTAVDASGNTELGSPEGMVHRFSKRSARFLRMNILKNSGNEAVHLLDFRAYGPTPTPVLEYPFDKLRAGLRAGV